MPRTDELQSKERLVWEKQVVRRAIDGDQKAFADLYHEYAPKIFARILMPRLGNRPAAEDALSETFRTALERLHQFESRDVSIYFWLCRIAMNKATDMHRVRARTRRALTSFHELLTPVQPIAAKPSDAIEAASELKVLRQRIQAIFDKLNPRYRRAIELRFLEDQSRQRCAELLDVKIGTFDVLILRSLRAFRREWDRAMNEEA